MLKSSESNDLRMCSDSERFASMVGRGLFEEDWIKLCSIGVVCKENETLWNEAGGGHF